MPFPDPPPPSSSRWELAHLTLVIGAMNGMARSYGHSHIVKRIVDFAYVHPTREWIHTFEVIAGEVECLRLVFPAEFILWTGSHTGALDGCIYWRSVNSDSSGLIYYFMDDSGKTMPLISGIVCFIDVVRKLWFSWSGMDASSATEWFIKRFNAEEAKAYYDKCHALKNTSLHQEDYRWQRVNP